MSSRELKALLADIPTTSLSRTRSGVAQADMSEEHVNISLSQPSQAAVAELAGGVTLVLNGIAKYLCY